MNGVQCMITPENKRNRYSYSIIWYWRADQILFAGDKAVEPATPTKKDSYLVVGL